MSCWYKHFQGRLQNFERRLLACRVHLSVRMEQVGYHWTDFHEILIVECLWGGKKKFEKIQDSLKSD